MKKSMNDEEKRASLFFVILLVIYLMASQVFSKIGFSAVIANILKLIIVSATLFIGRRWIRFKARFDWAAILAGLAIATIWIVIDKSYPHLGSKEVTTFSNGLLISLKLLIGVLIAPTVEEFFTRFFLHRFIDKTNWLKVKLGTYSLTPFIITTLFFGFSHSRWLAGLIAGALLNGIWYLRKDMNSVILAHATANLLLGVFVISFGQWQFW